MSIFESMSFWAIGINALMILIIFLASAFVAFKIFKIDEFKTALMAYTATLKTGDEIYIMIKKGEN